MVRSISTAREYHAAQICRFQGFVKHENFIDSHSALFTGAMALLAARALVERRCAILCITEIVEGRFINADLFFAVLANTSRQSLRDYPNHRVCRVIWPDS